jgi:hypothetical protein
MAIFNSKLFVYQRVPLLVAYNCGFEQLVELLFFLPTLEFSFGWVVRIFWS